MKRGKCIKNDNREIDLFQNKCLKSILLRVRWQDHISTEELLKMAETIILIILKSKVIIIVEYSWGSVTSSQFLFHSHQNMTFISF